jgi:hypothetical protein
MCSQGADVISAAKFTAMSTPKNADYVRKYVLPRLFAVMDMKKDNVLDLEEYLRSVALFRLGTVEDQIKLLYLMYDGSKSGGCLTRENFRQMLLDASVCTQKEEIAVDVLEVWLADLSLLSDAMVQTAMVQFSSHSNKLDVQELTAFVKMESSVQGLIPLMQALIDS